MTDKKEHANMNVVNIIEILCTEKGELERQISYPQ